MARPFTYISSQMYSDLEVYFFKLILHTDSMEYHELPIRLKNKIDREIMLMDNLLITMRMFRQIPNNERAVMAKQKRTYPVNDDYRRLFRFSSPLVASRCLGINSSHIVANCKGKRPSAGGYRFSYADEYEEVVQPKKNKWYDD